ncbi:hypothetical protein BJ138DRAFT_1152219 [Hygrophoropsis aurantiaca]|uniref:Uncharacterized protein n=1 Tax=Hygrophoropsis aurantiaca TaxID=72124 RepID=A0ACB8ABT9_9AGAM|nr:hypothetical protein BJ138DRAFT_1152219 [Hygrophoropsis aurantiaca]
MFKSILTIPLFAALALAQGAQIGYPPQGTSVAPGSSLTVQVERPSTLTPSEEVAVAIGIQSCATDACTSPTEGMGQILYNGAFAPAYHEPGTPPYQNFTVQIPSTLADGTALIGVTHVALVGAVYYPLFQVLNRTITISTA